MPSKSDVVPELVQVVVSASSTYTSAVLCLVAPLYIADDGGSENKKRRIGCAEKRTSTGRDRSIVSTIV